MPGVSISTLLRRRGAGLLPCALLLATGSAVAQQTIRVPQDYTTIQGAIDAAQTGDTVAVSAGLYLENVVLATREITLVALAGPTQTTLDGNHLGPVVTVTQTPGTRTRISGFTIRNGRSLQTLNDPLSEGPSGIVLTQAGASISGNVFVTNAGADIGVMSASAAISSNTLSTAFAGNSCSPAGVAAQRGPTGIYLSGTSAILDAAGLPTPSVLAGNTIFGDGTPCSGVGVQAHNLGQPTALQGNSIRNNSLGVAAENAPLFLLQNLIYDNASGALHLVDQSAGPHVDPATTQLVNNTIVNNLTAPVAASASSPGDILLEGTAAHTAFLNNVLVGTTPFPVLTCVNTPGPSDTPLLFEHNDLYNTTNAAGSLASGSCFSDQAAALSGFGNLSADPRLAGSTDLHPLPGSPLIDAGNNSAPGLSYVPFRSGAPVLDGHAQAANSLPAVPFSAGEILLLGAATDFAGQARFLDGTGRGSSVVDLGAFEAPASSSTAEPPPLFTLLRAESSLAPPGTITVTAATSAAGSFTTGSGITFAVDATDRETVTPDASGDAVLALPLPTPGLYAVTARPAGAPAGSASSGSPMVYVRVTDATPPGATTLTLAASPTLQVSGQPITLTVRLGSSLAADVAGPVPPGDVTLLEDGIVVTTLQPDATGLATYVDPRPTTGTHLFSVSYAGTSLYAAATATTSVTVNPPVATALTATISPDPAASGERLTLSVTVRAATGSVIPTGSVTATDGATLLGSGHLSAGAVSLSVATLSPGLHTIVFTYAPDPAFSAASSTAYLTVGGQATTTVLSATPHAPSTAESVQLTVSVTTTGAATGAPPPTGSVAIMDDATLLVSSPYPTPAGSLVFTSRLQTPGPHHLTAVFTPATTAWSGSSSTLTLTVNAAVALSAVLSAQPSGPVTPDQSIALRVAVSPATAIPAGSRYHILDGSRELASGPISADLALAALVLSPGELAVGSHSLSAVVSGPLIAAAVSSNTIVEQVLRSPAVLTLAASPAATAYAGNPITLSATLTSSGTPLLTPTGQIIFTDGTLVLGLAPLGADAVATLSVPGLSVGTHQLAAAYAGTSSLAAATSNPVTALIQLNATTTHLAVLPGTSSAFAPVVLTASVTSLTTPAKINTTICNPACLPAAVTFLADTPGGRITLGTAAVDATGVASLTITPAANTYAFAAVFSGTPLFAGSTSAVTALTIAPVASALAFTAEPDTVYQQESVHLSAALSATGLPSSARSGNVTFFEGSTRLGSSTLGTGVLAYTPVEVGTHTLTAVFAGNANLLGSSASLAVTVLPSDFVLSVKDPTLTIPMEHHAPTTVTINTAGAFADVIYLSCLNLPQNAHCTFSPATLDLTQSGASAATLTLDTDALINYAGTGQTPWSPPRSGSSPAGTSLGAVLALSLPAGLLPCLAWACRRRSPRPHNVRSSLVPNLLTALLLSVGLVALAGCSGLSPGHLDPGSYVITVSGHARSSDRTHTATFTLVVTR